MRGTGVELACFYWVAPPEEAGHRLAFLGHHHEHDRRAEAPRAQTIPATRSKRFCARSFERSPSRGSVRARSKATRQIEGGFGPQVPQGGLVTRGGHAADVVQQGPLRVPVTSGRCMAEETVSGELVSPVTPCFPLLCSEKQPIFPSCGTTS